MTKFRVTKDAPDEILGKRVKAGDTISLTKEQSEHLLRKRHIEQMPVAKEFDQSGEALQPSEAVAPAKAPQKAENGKRS